ncbi:GNAT family N-acetyltransferase [Streptomyces hiroshimensis]|uniref:N-acetyltransferase n=1 Tax=Streptomyces hiroshimensis TaxID=66424 RepID=A0ABQ2Y593_9ACTN|nr:GNAT family N-acetyltransferase [Streptomyces hiroshimensis]GGX63605.1 N-acetyltransferase [Streptomyces hiroshimensis]
MVRIRTMTEDDIDAVAEIRVGGWRTAYAGLVPQGHLDAMDAAEDAARHRRLFRLNGGLQRVNLVAESADGVAGWACYGPCRDADATDGDGELYALYVRPDLIGTGAGRALCTAVTEGAAARGFRRMLLWVLEGNHRARAFYTHAGFVPDGSEQPYEVAGVSVPEVRYAMPLPVT